MGARPDDVVYGRRMYEIMRYWDDDQLDSDADDREFAAVWRSQRKWVVSNSLTSVGPNATLSVDDFEAVIRRLKAQLDGEISVAGPNLAGRLTDVGLIDEYRLYVHPVVLGSGQPFFAGPRPRLCLVSSDRIGPKDVILRAMDSPLPECLMRLLREGLMSARTIHQPWQASSART